MLKNEALEANMTVEPETTPTQKASNLQALGIILLSVALGAVGQLVFKAAMNSIGVLEPSLELLVRMATNPLLLLGGGIFGASTVLWLLALSRADLSFAYPFLSLTYVAVLLGGALLFSEQITPPRIIGFVVVVAGLIIVARGEQST
jgi:drug/metabolite transporter (DMT)-like permease